MIGIIGAMDVEIDELLKKIEQEEIVEVGTFKYYQGILCGQEVVILKTGIAKTSAAVGASIMIDRFKPDFIINTGIAGGMEPFNVKDLVIPSHLSYGDVDATPFSYEVGQVPGMPLFYEADYHTRGRIVTACQNIGLEVKDAPAVTSDTFVTNLAQVRTTLKEPFIMEMEGAAIAQTCHLLKTPFVAIRFLSDIVGSDKHVENYSLFEAEMACLSAQILMEILVNI